MDARLTSTSCIYISGLSNTAVWALAIAVGKQLCELGCAVTFVRICTSPRETEDLHEQGILLGILLPRWTLKAVDGRDVGVGQPHNLYVAFEFGVMLLEFDYLPMSRHRLASGVWSYMCGVDIEWHGL